MQNASRHPDGTIQSFQEFSQLFGEKFAANVVKPPRMADLFDVRQREGESLKGYLNRFCEIFVCVQNPQDEMVIYAFVKGLRPNPFSDSLLRERQMSMTEIRERVSVHTITEEAIRRKKSSERQDEGRYQKRIREAQSRSTETTVKWSDNRWSPPSQKIGSLKLGGSYQRLIQLADRVPEGRPKRAHPVAQLSTRRETKKSSSVIRSVLSRREHVRWVNHPENIECFEASLLLQLSVICSPFFRTTIFSLEFFENFLKRFLMRSHFNKTAILNTLFSLRAL